MALAKARASLLEWCSCLSGGEETGTGGRMIGVVGGVPARAPVSSLKDRTTVGVNGAVEKVGAKAANAAAWAVAMEAGVEVSSMA